MDITVEADTLDDTHRELLARTPSGEFVLSETIESDGQPAMIRSSAATSQEAYAKAESLVPEGATILERRETQAHRRRTIEVEAVDKTSAGQIALQHAPEGATVGSADVAQPGSRGFLGFGRRVTRWRVTLDDPAVVEVRYRSRARISARTGSRPESWRALATAMRALAPTSPSHQALAKAWPYQCLFLTLTGFDHPASFLDLPLPTITPAIVDRALQYIELRRIPPGILAIAGAVGAGLRADRYQNMGAGRIGKVVNLVTDGAIVTTSSCLPRSKLNIFDVEGIGRYAFEAIQHYATIPVVNFCFRLPSADRILQPIIQTAIQAKPSDLILDPIADQIEVYKGTEALMLEIWEELQEGQVITDERMALKAQAILAAPVEVAPPDAPAPGPQKTKEQRVPEAITHDYAHGVQEALQVASSPAPPALGTPLATLNLNEARNALEAAITEKEAAVQEGKYELAAEWRAREVELRNYIAKLKPAVVGVVGTERAGHDKRVAPVQRVFVCRGAYQGKEGLYLVDGEGKVAEELAHPAPDERFGHVAVSPDGRWVAYTCYVRRRADRDLYPIIRAVPAVGGKSCDLAHWDPRYETCYQNPVFSPTGEKMVCEFALQHPHNPDLRVLKLYDWGDRLDGSSTGLSIINPMRIGNHAPQFMPDGERIVYFGNFAYEDLLEVCLYDPSAAEHQLLGEVGWRLTESADGVWHRPRAIAVQPEWEQIFFIQGHTRSTERICVFLLSDLSPGTHWKIFDAIGKEHQRIGALEMSRDGRYLAYDGDGAIYMVDADGGNLRRVSPEGIDCKCPQFSEDGAQLAYVGDGKLYTSYRDGDSSVKLTGAELRVDAFVWK